jgi:hypothetical protein
VTLERGSDDLLGSALRPDVAGDPRAAAADLRRGLLEHILPSADDRDRCAAARQLTRRGLAEVGAAAGDDCDRVRERSVLEHPRGLHGYSPITLITSRFARWPSNSQ